MTIAKQVNDEPIPGYRLLQRIGQGSFGEVWKCEAPGGLIKAIKFVGGNDESLYHDPEGAAQELQALQRIKALRHPFLLSIERLEFVDNTLVLVTELADRSLNDVLLVHRQAGRDGIPRAELLGYLRETAEVLDLMNLESGLQHLDVKPHNIFLVGRHIKVGDFGLVNSLADLDGSTLFSVRIGAISPFYAAPETFEGHISLFCDQYSLAVTYHELLTGTIPFRGTSFRQLALAHQRDEPELWRLPEKDRAAVARALAKHPRQRFQSCTEFVDALEGKGPSARLAWGEASPAQALATSAAHTVVFYRPVVGAASEGTVSTGDIPTASLERFRLIECLAQQPEAETWKAVDPEGRLRQLLLLSVPQREGFVLETARDRLQSLKHAILPTADVLFSGERLAVVTDPPRWTLADELAEQRRRGQPGLPREELLEYLLDVATALEELSWLYRVQHLALSPRQLILSAAGRLQLADFGLAEMVWLPSGRPAATLNPAYGAPELQAGTVSPACDQYSLALIYQELLTGKHPFRARGSRGRGAPAPGEQPDLAPLPEADRPVVARALSPDPEQRFPSCLAFLDSLTSAGKDRGGERAAAAPTPGPFPPGRKVSVLAVSPLSMSQALRDLVRIASGGDQVFDVGDGVRCVVRPGPTLVHRFMACLPPAEVRKALEDFRAHWGAAAVTSEPSRFVCHIPLPASLLRRLFSSAPALKIEARLRLTAAAQETPLIFLMTPLHTEAGQASRLLESWAPVLLKEVRGALQASPERRGQERWPFEAAAQVWPLANATLAGGPLSAHVRDVSLNGMRLHLPSRPTTQEVFIRVALPQGRDPLDLIGRVANMAPWEDGSLEVGVHFPSPWSAGLPLLPELPVR